MSTTRRFFCSFVKAPRPVMPFSLGCTRAKVQAAHGSIAGAQMAGLLTELPNQLQQARSSPHSSKQHSRPLGGLQRPPQSCRPRACPAAESRSPSTCLVRRAWREAHGHVDARAMSCVCRVRSAQIGAAPQRAHAAAGRAMARWHTTGAPVGCVVRERPEHVEVQHAQERVRPREEQVVQRLRPLACGMSAACGHMLLLPGTGMLQPALVRIESRGAARAHHKLNASHAAGRAAHAPAAWPRHQAGESRWQCFGCLR